MLEFTTIGALIKVSIYIIIPLNTNFMIVQAVLEIIQYYLETTEGMNIQIDRDRFISQTISLQSPQPSFSLVSNYFPAFS